MVNDASRGTNRTVVGLAFWGVGGADPRWCEVAPRSSTQRARIHSRTGGAAAAIAPPTSKTSAASLGRFQLLPPPPHTPRYPQRGASTTPADGTAESPAVH